MSQVIPVVARYLGGIRGGEWVQDRQLLDAGPLQVQQVQSQHLPDAVPPFIVFPTTHEVQSRLVAGGMHERQLTVSAHAIQELGANPFNVHKGSHV